jgi:hypothetical protein
MYTRDKKVYMAHLWPCDVHVVSKCFLVEWLGCS